MLKVWATNIFWTLPNKPYKVFPCWTSNFQLFTSSLRVPKKNSRNSIQTQPKPSPQNSIPPSRTRLKIINCPAIVPKAISCHQFPNTRPHMARQGNFKMLCVAFFHTLILAPHFPWNLSFPPYPCSGYFHKPFNRLDTRGKSGAAGDASGCLFSGLENFQFRSISFSPGVN